MSIVTDLESFYQGKRVAVTGGASFIGSHLTELLVRHGASVTVIDDLSSGKTENLAAVGSDVEFVRQDLRAEERATALLAPAEIVFHLAAQHGGRGYIESHPVECMNNMVLDHAVFQAAARGKAEKIIFASSACVYPTVLQSSNKALNLLKESDANFEEPGKAFSDGEYGWAKLMGELQLRAFHKQYGMHGIACRIFTAYGERENESHAVIALMAKALRKLDPYPIWGDGLQTRNFTYVGDTVMGLALAGAKLEKYEAINVGTETHHTIMDLIEIIFRELDWRPASIDRQLDKPVGVLSRAADISRSRRLLGWAPGFPLEEGVHRTLQWYAQETRRGQSGDLETLLVER
jgi:UDP-glucose 4-epimerase